LLMLLRPQFLDLPRSTFVVLFDAPINPGKDAAMSSPKYVWEKMRVAIDHLCGDGPFASRLADATVSALIRLNDDDLTGELGEDLKYILDWTKRNMEGGLIRQEPDESEKKKLVDKMLHVLVEMTEADAHAAKPTTKKKPASAKRATKTKSTTKTKGSKRKSA
jgi:hypothetical protein